MFKIFRLVALLLLWMSLSAQGKTFRNSYISFEMPETWKCALENTEWVCRPEAAQASKEAIIVLTAKEVGPTDTFDAYTAHLNSPQSTTYKGAPAATSKVVYPPKKVSINDQPWIDGLQMASEVPNYFTRYLATIKDRIAILFTCSAHKDYYKNYSQDFFKAVQSLRVVATKDILAKQDSGIRPPGETLSSPIANAMPADLMTADDQAGTSSDAAAAAKNKKNMLLGLGLLLAAVGVYIVLKSRKK